MIRALAVAGMLALAIGAAGALDSKARAAKFDGAEWAAFVEWCNDLLEGKGLTQIEDPVGGLRWKAGRHLMSEHSLKLHKAHCKDVVDRDWCRRFKDGPRCGTAPSAAPEPAEPSAPAKNTEAAPK